MSSPTVATAAAASKKRPFEQEEKEEPSIDEVTKKLKSIEDDIAEIERTAESKRTFNSKSTHQALVKINVGIALGAVETMLQAGGDIAAAKLEMVGVREMDDADRAALSFAEKMYAHIEKEAQAWAEQQPQ